MLRDEIAKIAYSWNCSSPTAPAGEARWIVADQILALIDGQRCEWTIDEAYIEYTTGCGHTIDIPHYYRTDKPFCPCCGKRIEVKDGIRE